MRTQSNTKRKRQGRIRTSQRISNSLYQKQRIIWIGVSAISILTIIGLILFFQFGRVEYISAATSGDFRTKSSGNWNATSTWEKYNGSSWVAATSTPVSGSGIIAIQPGHLVNVTSNITVDQVVILSGATVDINSGMKLTVGNGSGTDLDVYGTLICTGTLSSAGSAKTSFHAGSIYRHNRNGGALPVSTWDPGSLCEITGVISTLPTNLTQAFADFNWNCPGQTATSLDFGGDLSTINGDLRFVSTGSGEIMLGKTKTFTITVGGNLFQQGGTIYASRTSCTLNVAGNYTQTGGILSASDAAYAGAGSYTFIVNVFGNVNISGGTLYLSKYTGSTSGYGIGTLYIMGNYTQTGGLISETSSNSANSGYGEVVFFKAGAQTYSFSGGTISNKINFKVFNNTTLLMGTSCVVGNGNFSVLNGGTLLIASPDGITSSGALGQIQVTGTRSFSSSANYIYCGTGAQVTGNGLPTTVNNLTINNSNNVTLTNTVSVSGILNLTSGKVITGSNELVITNASMTSLIGYSTSNYVCGNLRRQVNASGSYDFPVGTSIYYEYVNVNLNGIAGFTNILGSFANSNPVPDMSLLNGVVINGSKVDDMLDYGYWTLTPNSAMTSGSYDVTVKEKGHSNSGNNEKSYCLLKRNNSSSPWQSLGVHSNNSQKDSSGFAIAARTGFTSFSQFAIGKNKGVGGLPIKLISFDAKKSDDIVKLTWVTAVEINNDYFTIERSSDGILFESILTQRGAGNSSLTLYYADQDDSPLQGTSYYRLKQTDYDGHFTYSKIVSIENGGSDLGDEMIIKSVSPNPFTDNFKLSYTVSSGGMIQIQLLNNSGQLVYKEIVNAEKGFNSYEFNDRSGLPNGIYYVNMIFNSKMATTKIIKF